MVQLIIIKSEILLLLTLEPWLCQGGTSTLISYLLRLTNYVLLNL